MDNGTNSVGSQAVEDDDNLLCYRTALAEAELEYDPHYKSKEVYVSFPIGKPPQVAVDFLNGYVINFTVYQLKVILLFPEKNKTETVNCEKDVGITLFRVETVILP